MNEFEIVHITETNSTLSFIKELQKEGGLSNGFTIYADFQNSGRGQKGNSWESERGKNLLFSTILFPNSLEAHDQFILSQIVSLSIIDVLSDESSDFSIKWPNDIYWHKKKIAGILIENNIMGDFLSQSAIGVGINLNQTNFMSDAPNPISLKQVTQKTYDIRKMLAKIIEKIKFYYESSNSEKNIEKIRSEYKKHLFRKRGAYLFADEGGTFEAEIEDVENSGLLVLKKKSGKIQKYAFKEIRYVL